MAGASAFGISCEERNATAPSKIYRLAHPTIVNPNTFAPVATTPNFFLVGAAKAGTTALWRYLRQHPEISFSPIKETHFFSSDIDTAAFRPEFAKDAAFDTAAYIASGMKEPVHQAFVRDETHYRSLFQQEAPAVGEATVSYLWSAKAAQNIHQFNPDARIVMMLRNPAERAFSHFVMDLRMGYANGSFQEAVLADLEKPQGWGRSNLYLDLGRYHQQVQRYLNTFPPEQVLVLWHEDYKAESNAVLRQIFQFLGINDAIEIDTSERHNTAKLPKHKALQSALKSNAFKKTMRALLPAAITKSLKQGLYTTKGLPTLSDADRAFVNQYLGPDIEALSLLLGRDLSHWLK